MIAELIPGLTGTQTPSLKRLIVRAIGFKVGFPRYIFVQVSNGSRYAIIHLAILWTWNI
jgi:hypothetical protein